jgi:hypothetical protein
VVETSTATRAIAAVVFCVLAVWAWRLVAADSATGIGLAVGRQALSLYDSVPVGTGLRRRFTAAPRIGTPPALR